MLAEPRRKVRIGPNPRGKFFQEDEDNRGRQMLLKMGWKTGDGLGVTCHGMSEPIKPKVNTESRGLGYDRKQDPWVAHNEEFEQLLKSLNSGSDDQGNNEDSSSNDGLEKKSKGSKSRIHYQKFVKNKDLSRATCQDMSGIFGKSLDDSKRVAPNAVKEEDQLESKKKKKSKKRKYEEEEIQEESPLIEENEVEKSSEVESEVKKKKKKKSKKNSEEKSTADADTNEDSTQQNNINEPVTQTEPSIPSSESEEKLGSMQFINRGSIDDYFRMKRLQMQERLAAAARANSQV